MINYYIKSIRLKAICLIIIFGMVLFWNINRICFKIIKKCDKKIINSINKNSIVKNKDTFNDEQNLIKYQNMFPLLYRNSNSHNILKKKDDLFNAREMYITGVRITTDYIKFIRSINEDEEQKPKNNLIEKEIIVDNNIYKKRQDQYKYRDFCKLAIKEKLISEIKIDKDYKPIISVIIPTYNKQNILLKSIRSIQNQNFKNLEIIIVNDFSDDNSTNVFDYLLKTDLRIRNKKQKKNLGVFKSRLDGILYSRGKYIILFDPGDFYEDNYVLSDAYNILEQYNLDSCKFIYRYIYNLINLKKTRVRYHTNFKAKIVYEPNNIKSLDSKVFKKSHAIWNRLVRSNIYIKGILLLNELTLNAYKNLWDDLWYNEIVNKASHNYTIIERIGYVYYVDGKGEGTPKFHTEKQKSNLIREYIAFLYYDLNFCKGKESKDSIIKKLRNYNGTDSKKSLNNFRSHFEILNNLLEALIKDHELKETDRKFCLKLLNESKYREKNVNIYINFSFKEN